MYLGYMVVGYTSERHGCTLPELIILSLSRTTNSHDAVGEHMVPGPFHSHSVAVSLSHLTFIRCRLRIPAGIRRTVTLLVKERSFGCSILPHVGLGG
jgi:hypothetical protein